MVFKKADQREINHLGWTVLRSTQMLREMGPDVTTHVNSKGGLMVLEKKPFENHHSNRFLMLTHFNAASVSILPMLGMS